MKLGDLNPNCEVEVRVLLEQFVGRSNTEELRQEITSVVSGYVETVVNDVFKEYVPLNTKIKEGEIERITNLLGVEDGKD